MKNQVLKLAALFMAATGFAPQAQADTDILTSEKGYAKVTGTMPANLSDYYFIIVDKDKDLMMTLGTGAQQTTQYKTWWYKASEDPATDRNRVWTIEENNGVNNADGYAFRNLNEPTFLMQTENNAAYNFRTHDQPNPCQWTQFIFAYDASGDYWTFENGKYPMSSDAQNKGYVGPWEYPIEENGETAANKSPEQRGTFVIYSIPKNTFNALELTTRKDIAQNAISDTYQAIADHSQAEEAVKTTYNTAISTATQAVTDAATVENIETAMNALETARQTYVQNAVPDEGYPIDMTFLIRNADGSSLDGWERTGNVGTNIGQHWNNPDFYIEPCNWGATGWDCGISQTVTLPNGHYTLRAAGRAATDASIALVANGETAVFASNGDVGGAIATDGTEWESIQAGLDAGKTFPNHNKGYGWSYQTLDVTVLDNTMTIGATSSSDAQHSWCSIDDFQLTFVSGLTEEEQLTVAKNELQALVTEAGGINISANVGTEAFQIPEAAVEAFEEAYAAATELLQQTPAPTLDETEQGIADLQAAIEAYRNTPLNAPTADERFNIILATQDNFQYRGMAVTFIGGRSDGEGEYSLNYQAAPNANYAQAFTLEKADGTNNYLMSFTGTDGQTNYACTGTHYGASTGDYGIRTTTDRSLALPFEVIATATEGVYNLRNTVANEYMGSQSEGFYTVNSHIEFNIKPAAKAEVALQITDAGWATLMLPYSADVPDGLTAYTYSGTETDAADNTVLQLTEAAALAANTPYIIKGNEGTYNFSGYGLATQDTYSTDGMTGTLVQTAAPADSYVLQNQSGQTGFYKVEAGSEPTIGAYRAYLNADVVAAGVNVRLILLDDDSATGIDAVQNDKDAAVNVYNLNGILVRENVKASEALNGLQRGIYIVNGTKKAVK